MPTNFRCLGPIEHFYRPFGQNTFNYLGTAVTSPMMKEGDSFLPIWNDIGGRSVPTQLISDRRKAIVVTTLNRFNWTNYNTLKGMTGNPGNAFYEETLLDHGVPVLGVGDIDLFLGFTFGGVVSGADTPSGRLYYGCVLKDWEEQSQGSRVVELTLYFEIYGRLNPSTRTFAKYSEDPASWGTLIVE